MRIARTLVLVLAITVLSAAVVSAQVPFIGAYFDQFGTKENEDCPGPNVPGELYFFAKNVNDFILGFEFAVEYPLFNFVHLNDFGFPAVTIGNTPTGVSGSFAIPQNGFLPVFLGGANILWTCDGCLYAGDEVKIVQHPLFPGSPRITRFPDFAIKPVLGLTSLTCPTVPTEETTWGNIKSLYNGE